MGKEPPTKTRTIRMAREIWETIEAQAEADDMTVNELVTRRLRKSFAVAVENRKTVDNPREPLNEPHDDDFDD